MAGLLDLLGLGGTTYTQNGQPTGLLGQFGGSAMSGLRDNSDSLMGFGMGMLSGATPGEGFANGLQGMQSGQNMQLKKKLLFEQEQEKMAKRQAAAIYAQKNPQFAEMLKANPDMAEKFALADYQKALNPTNPLDDQYKQAQIAELNSRTQGKNATFGLNPVYGTRKNPQTGEDETVILQPGNNGTIVEPKLPDGVKLANGIEKIDAGTMWIIKDKRTGQTIGTEPKNVAGEAAEAASGKAQGEAKVAVAGTVAAADQLLGQIDAVGNHPGKKWGLGMSGKVAGNVPGTDAQGFQLRVEQIKGGAYLQAIEKMRGLGALSEAEGRAATAAVTRLNTASNQKEFDDALAEFRGIVETGKRNAIAKAGGNFTPGAAAAPKGNDTLSAADAIVGIGK